MSFLQDMVLSGPPISTPHFGACLNEMTQVISSCALAPNECMSDTIYIPPNEVEENICNSALQLKTGRCSADIDNQNCAANSDACQDSESYDIAVKYESCSIIQDTQSSLLGANTLYPYCVSGDDTLESPERCVLNKDDCMFGEDFMAVTTVPWMEPCFCHHVATGMCYLEFAELLTASSSFCAVGPYDCPEGYLWMSSNELSKMENPPHTCQLCQEEELNSATQHEHVVESGGCYADDNLLHCALESKECKVSTVFKSTIEMRELGHVPCAADHIEAGYCAAQFDDTGCTNIAEGCEFPDDYMPLETCTIHSDLFNKVPTYFGHCRERSNIRGDWGKYRCSWQSSECIPTMEEWNHAREPEAFFDGCNCEHVHTGACSYVEEGTTNYFCAVSELGCNDPSNYIMAVDVTEKTGMDCRLCQPLRNEKTPTSSPISQPKTTVPESTAAPSSSPIKDSLRLKMSAPPSSQGASIEINENDLKGTSIEINENDLKKEDSLPSTFSLAEIVGGVTGGVVAGCAFLSLCVVVLFHMRKAEKRRQSMNTGGFTYPGLTMVRGIVA